LIRGHRDDDVFGFEGVVAGGDEIPVALSGQAVDLYAAADGKLESLCVRIEVIAHLVFRRKAVSGRRERHAVEAVELRPREEAERIPSHTPGVADSLVRVEDDKGKIAARQMVPDRQTSLSCADDYRLDALGVLIVAHD